MTPSIDGFVRVELSVQHYTNDSGALLLRQALGSSGVIAALEDSVQAWQCHCRQHQARMEVYENHNISYVCNILTFEMILL